MKDLSKMNVKEQTEYFEMIIDQILKAATSKLQLVKMIQTNPNISTQLTTEVLKDIVNWSAAHEALHSAPIKF